MRSAPNTTAITSHAGNFAQASGRGKGSTKKDAARTSRSVPLGRVGSSSTGSAYSAIRQQAYSRVWSR
jgi:hypothetical protein